MCPCDVRPESLMHVPTDSCVVYVRVNDGIGSGEYLDVNKKLQNTDPQLMCRKVGCPVCRLPTWQGCGQHVNFVLVGEPLDERCPAWRTGAGSHKLSSGAETQRTPFGNGQTMASGCLQVGWQ